MCVGVCGCRSEQSLGLCCCIVSIVTAISFCIFPMWVPQCIAAWVGVCVCVCAYVHAFQRRMPWTALFSSRHYRKQIAFINMTNMRKNPWLWEQWVFSDLFLSLLNYLWTWHHPWQIGFVFMGLTCAIIGDSPDFQLPMTVIHDQTEEGQPSSQKVSTQPWFYRFC